MFGYESIKTIELNELKSDLVKSEKQVRNLKNRNEVLECKVGVLDKLIETHTRKRECGQFVAKVKMFEPFKILVTPAQSERVQKILLAEGEVWISGGKDVRNVNFPYLSLRQNGIGGGTNPFKFADDKLPEITYRQFMRIYSPKQVKA